MTVNSRDLLWGLVSRVTITHGNVTKVWTKSEYIPNVNYSTGINVHLHTCSNLLNTKMAIFIFGEGT